MHSGPGQIFVSVVQRGGSIPVGQMYIRQQKSVPLSKAPNPCVCVSVLASHPTWCCLHLHETSCCDQSLQDPDVMLWVHLRAADKHTHMNTVPTHANKPLTCMFMCMMSFYLQVDSRVGADVCVLCLIVSAQQWRPEDIHAN